LENFRYSDGWLLYSLSRRYNSIKDIISTGDHYNHSIFTYEEINGGLLRLIQNGLAESSENKYKISSEGLNFKSANQVKYNDSISEMINLCEVMSQTTMNVDVDYSISILSISDYNKAINKYKKGWFF
jgi:hypothetical protein